MDSRRNPLERRCRREYRAAPRNGGSIASHYDERAFARGRGMDQFVLSTTEGRVALLTLNRPEILNAWHRPMRSQLVAKLEAAEREPAIGAIVMTGAGDRAFGAGQDLNE